MGYWLSYGAGVNSTALMVMICEGRLPEYEGTRILFSDTLTERPETYAYIDHVVRPYLSRHGRELEVCAPPEGVFQRWQRLGVIGSRRFRACTDHGKKRPMAAYIKASGDDAPIRLIGIHADEAHRAARGDADTRYPLIDLDMDQQDCEEAIRAAGLCMPVKSGCWCCPFMRSAEILDLARTRPALVGEIAALEVMAEIRHGQKLYQWRDTPALDFLRIAADAARQHELFSAADLADEPPCECFEAASTGSLQRTCEHCGGVGQIEPDNNAPIGPCPVCGGGGKMSLHRTNRDAISDGDSGQ